VEFQNAAIGDPADYTPTYYHKDAMPKCSPSYKVYHDKSEAAQSGVRSQQEGRTSLPPSSSVEDAKVEKGVSAFADSYDSLLLDQFGVLHDGRVAYPAALDAVRRLAEAGKRLVILSNSGRRAEDTLAKLEPLGFDPSWFAGAVTSGETTHQALELRTDPVFANLGPRCLHFQWSERGAVQVDELGLVHVTDPEQADFVLAHGMEAVSGGSGQPALQVSLDDIKSLLRVCARRSLPLVIANPDLVTVDTTKLVPMPGQCGVWYKEFDGPPQQVILMGKPAAVIYDAAKQFCRGRVLAVGDSLAHDIAGAQGAGIDSLFIANGIHAKDLEEGPLTAAGVAKLAASHGCAEPTYIMDAFRF
jgi:HAD superfamily hydrolase (TIGR01459 family)